MFIQRNAGTIVKRVLDLTHHMAPEIGCQLSAVPDCTSSPFLPPSPSFLFPFLLLPSSTPSFPFPPSLPPSAAVHSWYDSSAGDRDRDPRHLTHRLPSLPLPLPSPAQSREGCWSAAGPGDLHRAHEAA